MPRKRYDANCTLQTSSRVVRARLQRFMTVVVVSLVIEVWLLNCLVQLGGKPDRGRSYCEGGDANRQVLGVGQMAARIESR